MQKYPRCVLCVLIRCSRMSVHTHNTKVSSKSLSCIDIQNRTKTTAERCQKMHRRGGLSLVNCSPILAVYFYLLCRSRHSSQTCIGICRFRKQADVLVTTTPKSKMPNRGHSTTKSGRSAVCYAGRAGAEGRM